MLTYYDKNIINVADSFGAETVEKLKQAHINAGQEASGETLESFKYDVIEADGKILISISGSDYVEFTDRGRGGGGMTPVESLEKWISDKGVFGALTETETKSLAWAIAKTHAASGSYQNRNNKTYNGTQSPVFSDMVLEDTAKLVKELGLALTSSIQSGIIEQYRINNKIQ
jgi:hypothetical protein